MPSNTAAWQMASKQIPMEVKSAPYKSPPADGIVVKNAVVAINPVDAYWQLMGDDLFPGTTYPRILGSDVAGEVVEVGSSVTRFKVGDRVIGLGNSFASNDNAESAFQSYTILLDTLACPIPSSMSYEAASVLPLCLSTATVGLFHQDFLALERPSLTPQPTGKTLLIWGGASGVGLNGIQLAKAAGYEVVTTCSPKNFDLVKKLGASQAFDYKSDKIVDELVAALSGKTIAGAMTAAPAGAQETLDIVARCTGNKFVSLAMPLKETVPDGVKADFIWVPKLRSHGVADAIWGDFVPKALAQGKYVTAPEFEVAGKGLESIQTAFELFMKGVSAKKIVVSL